MWFRFFRGSELRPVTSHIKLKLINKPRPELFSAFYTFFLPLDATPALLDDPQSDSFLPPPQFLFGATFGSPSLRKPLPRFFVGVPENGPSHRTVASRYEVRKASRKKKSASVSSPGKANDD